jgi:excisionase family DNA binding protein
MTGNQLSNTCNHPDSASSIASFPRQSCLFSRDEAAAYLGIRSQTLAVWATTGRYNLPMVKVGRLVKYRKADLDSFIERRTVGATAE